MTIMQTLAASGSVINFNYGGQNSGVKTYSGFYGYSVDNFNGVIKVTIGYWYSSSYSTTSWHQLRNYTSGSTLSFAEVAQFTLNAGNVGVIQYATGASGYVKKPCNCIFSNPIYAYGQNIAAQTGQGTPVGSAPGAAWMVAARYNGGRSLTIYLNAGRNGTGDTGTSISMANMGPAFGDFAGSYQFQTGTDKSGNPVYETRYYTDYTFTF